MVEKKLEVIKQYIALLEKGEASQIIELFGREAVVTSPRTPPLRPEEFYLGLFVNLKTSSIKLIDIFHSIGSKDAFAVHFIYSWQLKDNSEATLKCVDLIEFDPSGKISKLDVVAYPVQG